MRRKCLDMVYQMAREDPRIMFVGSDLGFGTLDEMASELPDQFVMEGINEAHAVGMATGLAMEGKIVYFNTIATFITRRAYEQVILDACMHRQRVRFIGNGGGLVYAPLGATHLAFEDLACMRAIPDMTIVAPADAGEMERFMPHSVEHPNPIYIRLAKGYDPVVTDPSQEFAIGRGYLLRAGGDALLVTTGIGARLCLAAADRLAAGGLEAAVLHLPTVKPLDEEMVLDLATQSPVVVSVEEHTVVGGLGSAIAELLAEANMERTARFRRLGVPDVFPAKYGSQDSLMEYYGLHPDNIADTVRSLASA